MEETALQQSVLQLEVIVPEVEITSDTAQEKVRTLDGYMLKLLFWYKTQYQYLYSYCAHELLQIRGHTDGCFIFSVSF